MKTAKEFWISKFPDAEKDWQKTGHDDNFQVRMMEEYAKYHNEQQVNSVDLADVVNRRELLLDFADYSERDKTSETTDECVDNYLDSIK